MLNWLLPFPPNMTCVGGRLTGVKLEQVQFERITQTRAHYPSGARPIRRARGLCYVTTRTPRERWTGRGMLTCALTCARHVSGRSNISTLVSILLQPAAVKHALTMRHFIFPSKDLEPRTCFPDFWDQDPRKEESPVPGHSALGRGIHGRPGKFGSSCQPMETHKNDKQRVMELKQPSCCRDPAQTPQSVATFIVKGEHSLASAPLTLQAYRSGCTHLVIPKAMGNEKFLAACAAGMS